MNIGSHCFFHDYCCFFFPFFIAVPDQVDSLLLLLESIPLATDQNVKNVKKNAKIFQISPK